MVVLAKGLLDVDSGFLGVVVRHGGEEVMGNVGVGNVMVEVVEEETVRTINSQSGTTLEVPDVFTVMRQLGVSVLQIGDQDQPKVNI